MPTSTTGYAAQHCHKRLQQPFSAKESVYDELAKGRSPHRIRRFSSDAVSSVESRLAGPHSQSKAESHFSQQSEVGFGEAHNYPVFARQKCCIPGSSSKGDADTWSECSTLGLNLIPAHVPNEATLPPITPMDPSSDASVSMTENHVGLLLYATNQSCTQAETQHGPTSPDVNYVADENALKNAYFSADAASASLHAETPATVVMLANDEAIHLSTSLQSTCTNSSKTRVSSTGADCDAPIACELEHGSYKQHLLDDIRGNVHISTSSSSTAGTAIDDLPSELKGRSNERPVSKQLLVNSRAVQAGAKQHRLPERVRVQALSKLLKISSTRKLCSLLSTYGYKLSPRGTTFILVETSSETGIQEGGSNIKSMHKPVNVISTPPEKANGIHKVVSSHCMSKGKTSPERAGSTEQQTILAPSMKTRYSPQQKPGTTAYSRVCSPPKSALQQHAKTSYIPRTNVAVLKPKFSTTSPTRMRGDASQHHSHAKRSHWEQQAVPTCRATATSSAGSTASHIDHMLGYAVGYVDGRCHTVHKNYEVSVDQERQNRVKAAVLNIVKSALAGVGVESGQDATAQSPRAGWALIQQMNPQIDDLLKSTPREHGHKSGTEPTMRQVLLSPRVKSPSQNHCTLKASENKIQVKEQGIQTSLSLNGPQEPEQLQLNQKNFEMPCEVSTSTTPRISSFTSERSIISQELEPVLQGAAGAFTRIAEIATKVRMLASPRLNSIFACSEVSPAGRLAKEFKNSGVLSPSSALSAPSSSHVDSPAHNEEVLDAKSVEWPVNKTTEPAFFTPSYSYQHGDYNSAKKISKAPSHLEYPVAHQFANPPTQDSGRFLPCRQELNSPPSRTNSGGLEGPVDGTNHVYGLHPCGEVHFDDRQLNDSVAISMASMAVQNGAHPANIIDTNARDSVACTASLAHWAPSQENRKPHQDALTCRTAAADYMPSTISSAITPHVFNHAPSQACSRTPEKRTTSEFPALPLATCCENAPPVNFQAPRRPSFSDKVSLQPQHVVVNSTGIVLQDVPASLGAGFNASEAVASGSWPRETTSQLSGCASPRSSEKPNKENSATRLSSSMFPASPPVDLVDFTEPKEFLSKSPGGSLAGTPKPGQASAVHSKLWELSQESTDALFEMPVSSSKLKESPDSPSKDTRAHKAGFHDEKLPAERVPACNLGGDSRRHSSPELPASSVDANNLPGTSMPSENAVVEASVGKHSSEGAPPCMHVLVSPDSLGPSVDRSKLEPCTVLCSTQESRNSTAYLSPDLESKLHIACPGTVDESNLSQHAALNMGAAHTMQLDRGEDPKQANMATPTDHMLHKAFKKSSSAIRVNPEPGVYSEVSGMSSTISAPSATEASATTAAPSPGAAASATAAPSTTSTLLSTKTSTTTSTTTSTATSPLPTAAPSPTAASAAPSAGTAGAATVVPQSGSDAASRQVFESLLQQLRGLEVEAAPETMDATRLEKLGSLLKYLKTLQSGPVAQSVENHAVMIELQLMADRLTQLHVDGQELLGKSKQQPKAPHDALPKTSAKTRFSRASVAKATGNPQATPGNYALPPRVCNLPAVVTSPSTTTESSASPEATYDTSYSGCFEPPSPCGRDIHTGSLLWFNVPDLGSRPNSLVPVNDPGRCRQPSSGSVTSQSAKAPQAMLHTNQNELYGTEDEEEGRTRRRSFFMKGLLGRMGSFGKSKSGHAS